MPSGHSALRTETERCSVRNGPILCKSAGERPASENQRARPRFGKKLLPMTFSKNNTNEPEKMQPGETPDNIPWACLYYIKLFENVNARSPQIQNPHRNPFSVGLRY